ncbi:type I CRISPR-associated protein Cas7 [bacterium]|nr:type I CRISPR-associated protein Cas7 [bacterium]
MNEQNNEFKNRCYGLVIIKSENSNFNADFTGNPRRLPDEKGTIYATDKALKYAIRRYWVDRGKDVFVWRSHKENGTPRTRDERMDQIRLKFSKQINEVEKKLRESFKNRNIKTPEQNMIIYKTITSFIFSNCIDTKLFGVTYTGTGPLSLTGPVQISYGINKMPENTNYTSDILSPYADKPDAGQTSIGKDTKNLEACYIYDFSINPKNIISHYNSSDDIQEMMQLNIKDIDALKDALKYAVTSLDTTSKKDSENVMLLFITMPKDSNQFLPSMKNLVKISKNNGKTEIDLSELTAFLKDKTTETVELFYNKKIIKISGEDADGWTKKDNI